MRTSRLIPPIGVLTLTFAAATATAADYDITRVWDFHRGNGYSSVGGAVICADSGYPGTLLRLLGTYPSEVEPAYLGSAHAVLRVPATGDRVLIRLYSERGEDCAVGVRWVELANGVRWLTTTSAGALPVSQSYPDHGTSQRDRLYGTDAYGDALYGRGGNDTLYGYDGDDVLDGGSGSDILYGYEGDDFLFGDTGNDDLYGDEGDDTYVFAGAFGDDIIDDFEGGIRIELPDAPAEALAFARQGDDLVITQVGTTSVVRVRDLYYESGAYITEIRAKDGRWDGDPLVVAP